VQLRGEALDVGALQRTQRALRVGGQLLEPGQRLAIRGEGMRRDAALDAQVFEVALDGRVGHGGQAGWTSRRVSAAPAMSPTWARNSRPMSGV